MKYFIDCGTHFFEGYRQFEDKFKIDETWTVYSFEANPRTYKLSKNNIPQIFNTSNFQHLNLAVSNIDGEININCDMQNEEGTGDGSNILETPPSYDPEAQRHIRWETEKVNCFDLSKFILNLQDIETLIIKLDIEGAEFEVLEKIIKDKSYEKITELYVEFHERFFTGKIEQYRQIKNEYIHFFNNNNVKTTTWF